MKNIKLSLWHNKQIYPLNFKDDISTGFFSVSKCSNKDYGHLTAQNGIVFNESVLKEIFQNLNLKE